MGYFDASQRTMRRQGNQEDGLRTNRKRLVLPYSWSPTDELWVGLVPVFEIKEGEKPEPKIFRALRSEEMKGIEIDLTHEAEIIEMSLRAGVGMFSFQKPRLDFKNLTQRGLGCFELPQRDPNALLVWFIPHQRLDQQGVEATTAYAIERLLTMLFP